jgi:DMSO/TMAO reductase YedYZ molybdopterin-dependent catalytic subunit
MAPPSHTGISLSTKELAAMAEAKLHLVFGGRVSDPQTLDFKELDKLDVVGIFPNYNEAEEAWRAAAQRTVDDAEMRYVVVHLHKLLDPDHPSS